MSDGTDILEKDLDLVNKENEFNSVNLDTSLVSNNHMFNFNRTQKSNNKRKANEINPPNALVKCNSILDTLSNKLNESGSKDCRLTGNKIFCQFVETALDQISDPKKLNEAKYEIHTTLINILRN